MCVKCYSLQHSMSVAAKYGQMKINMIMLKYRRKVYKFQIK